jgi:hypothetical protein
MAWDPISRVGALGGLEPSVYQRDVVLVAVTACGDGAS